jgi:2-polyprenyl-6-methoxyphenol hydroxylase-like FAD-dependent oxidoreductase
MPAAFDVAVAGAGPAGAAAACLLARAGRRVALLDPRLGGDAPDKPGEALPGAADRLLRAAGLPRPVEGGAHRPIGGNISAWGQPDLAYRDFLADADGPGWRLDRQVFEADLVTAAAAAGATLCPQAARSAGRAGAAWDLGLQGGGSLEARWIVDATGRAGRIARALGAERRRDEDLVAVVGRGRPDAAFAWNRTLVETTPQGWWYAALLPGGAPIFMLHTRPEDAVRLVAAPAAWRAALLATRHVSAAFPGPVFDAPLRGFEACGAWLDPVWGDGWTACGDAALSFDPASAQGIFSALHGAMEVARAVDAALRGEAARLDAYAARLREIRRIYRQRVRAHYAEEQRWPDAPFWRERRA